MEQDTTGLYIHIPFCTKKCLFCNFFSVTNTPDDVYTDYLDALLLEYDIRCDGLNSKIDTIYMGGGTPSIIPHDILNNFFRNLFNRINASDIKEFTIEMHPSSVNANLLDVVSDLPSPRISLGIQTLDDKILNTIARDTSSENIIDAIGMIEKSCYKHGTRISVDFISGLPYSNKHSTSIDIIKVLNILPQIEHISLYSLELDERPNTKKRWESILPDEETSISAFNLAINTMNKFGFERYEVGNFSRSIESRSLHNLHYWNIDEYIGLGTAAVGCLNLVRYKNALNIKNYVASLRNNKLPDASYEELNLETRKREFIFLSLRQSKGINLVEYRKMFGSDFKENYKAALNKNKEYLLLQDGHLSVIPLYVNYTDEIAIEFFS